jgi:hypothetical protein
MESMYLRFALLSSTLQSSGEGKYGKDKAHIPDEELEKFWAKYNPMDSKTVCD